MSVPDFLPTQHTLTFATEVATEKFAQQLGSHVFAGIKIYLSGDLGSGKSTLVRALLRSLGVRGAIKSPSYSLVETYAIAGIDYHHFDFYRLTDPEAWLAAGFAEYFEDRAVVFVEWPEHAGDRLPSADLHLHLSLLSPDLHARHLELHSHTPRGHRLLTALITPLQNPC